MSSNNNSREYYLQQTSFRITRRVTEIINSTDNRAKASVLLWKYYHDMTNDIGKRMFIAHLINGTILLAYLGRQLSESLKKGENNGESNNSTL